MSAAGGSNDDGDEEEEVLVVAQFSDLRDPAFLEQTRLLRLRSFVDRPVCEADGIRFEGRHEACVGSLLLLRTDSDAPVPCPAPEIVLCNTRTNMLLRRIPLQDDSQP